MGKRLHGRATLWDRVIRHREDVFVKAIRFKDVQPNDVVEWAGHELSSYEIECVERSVDQAVAILATVTLYVKNRDYTLKGHPDQLIGLAHRPYPEGKTEEDMLNAVFSAFSQVSPFWMSARTPDEMDVAREVLKKTIQPLHEAIEAYELGKPPVK